MTNFNLSKWLKPAFLAGSVMALGACTYGLGGGGYYGDGYVNGAGYSCDPYAPFDDYYACDSGYGFANIGFGGGWYDNYYYPGYGSYLFDRGGQRFNMRNNHRRYWAQRRAQHGVKQGRRGDRRYSDRGRNLSPEQRAERRENRAERRENWSPERREAWRERRAANGGGQGLTRQERQERRANRGSQTGSSAATNTRSNNATRAETRRRMQSGMERRNMATPATAEPARTQSAAPPQRVSRPERQSRPQRNTPRNTTRSKGSVQDY